MIKNIPFIIFIILVSCESSLKDDEIKSFCYDFVYSIHSKDSNLIDTLVDQKNLVENTNNKLENYTVEYSDIITGLFLSYNPWKYGRSHYEKINNLNSEDLEIIIIENKGNIQRVNIKWDNIFSNKKESVIITIENKKIVLIDSANKF